ncbi:PAS domain-containing protein [Rhodobacter sp. SY28-1]|uniref:PAS domain-containing protein n=1 Tax=Rhodobacter sp. SY28-1 TaxID=2562317 RepID=UPI001484D12C|nr:PAS domain-containing protein [Rhodobacter sp. SY28-1]
MTLGFLDRLLPQPRTTLPAVIHGLSQTRAYWEGLRQGSALPQRKAIDPRGLVGVLDRVFLADRIGRGVAQIRIAGSALTDFAGMDVRGLPLSCLFGAESRGLLGDTLEKVFTGPAVAELDLGSDRTPGPFARLLLLPLEDETGGRLVLGAMGFAEERHARCKLQILSRREEVLQLARAAVDDMPLAVEPLRRRGHLALVHSAE